MYGFLCDVHLGTRVTLKEHMDALEMFLDHMKQSNEECHAIFVCGDLFDHKLNIEELKQASLYLLRLTMNGLGKDALHPHIPVKFVHGTYSHDYEQYTIFMDMLNKIPEVQVFYAEENCIQILNNGCKVLYLPQLYGNIDYTSSFDNEYDIIVGHGVINKKNKEVCPKSNQEIELPVETLGNISKICIFGHYHDYTDFGNNVYYGGSLMRWKYGEDVEKRFIFCNDKFEIETLKNPFAKEYKTVEITDPEELRDILSTNIETPHRFVIHCDKDTLETYHGIMNVNKKNPNLKYRIISEEVVNEETQNIEKLEEVNVSTNTIQPIPALISYIQDKYNVDTTKEINEYVEKIKE